jgi:hypothetical protein
MSEKISYQIGKTFFIKHIIIRMNISMWEKGIPNLQNTDYGFIFEVIIENNLKN